MLCDVSCDCTGCTIGKENPTAFQPKEPAVLCAFERNGHKFLAAWYGKYPWLTLCVKRSKVFCSYCRYAKEHNLITFSTRGDLAFSVNGFDNYKKAMEKFLHHEGSLSHQEAVMKCNAILAPSIQSRLSSLLSEQQQRHRCGLLKQLQALQFLLRQGLALRGHHEDSGNLHQLLQTWARDSEIVADWLKCGRFMSHDHVNELITLMGQDVLRRVLMRVKSSYPSWYGIIADEATDVVSNEQFNLSVRYVDHDYDVYEDSIGLFQLPSTDAATIASVIKDILIRLSLPLSLCRRQAYDGAATMQGKRTGVATRINDEAPAALSVHCFAHSLNLCLQGVSRNIVVIRDAMDLVREIVKLINFSPKRKTLFSSKLTENDQTGSTIKPLCPTRWTVRAASMRSVLEQYSVIMDTMQEVNETTRDEYGLKAGGVLAAMEKFSTLFGLRLGHLLFGAAEETSIALQAKDISLQEVLSSVHITEAFFKRQRTEDAFNIFYAATEELADKLEISQPTIPRYRKQPRRLDSGEDPHKFNSPKDFFRQKYYECCDLLIQELHERFDHNSLKPLVSIEKVIIKSANGENCTVELQEMKESVLGKDLDFPRLERHLSVLVDIIQQALPEVKKVTSIRTVCSAMKASSYRSTFSEVHKLLRLYLTTPMTSATSERAFSTMRRLLTYLRSSMTEKRLNNCALLHIHKDLTDALDLVAIAQMFSSLNDERIHYFGSFQ